jgi:hypothetical protein
MSNVHEAMHWVQFQGSSVGILIQLLLYSQTRHAFGIIHALPEARRAKALRGLAEKRMPGEEFSNLWLSHEVVFRALYEPAGMPHVPPGDEFDLVFGYAVPQVAGQLGFTAQTHGEWQFARRGPGTRLMVENANLSTRQIMESAACCAELCAALLIWKLQSASGRRDGIDLAAGKLMMPGSYYGAPFRHFLRVTGQCYDESLRLPRAFQLLADLALNPPVPPLAPPPDRKARWRDLSPPLRFDRLVRSIAKVGLPPESLDSALLREYSLKLADHAGVPLLSQGPWAHASFTEARTLAKYARDRPLREHTAFMEHFRYRVWVQRVSPRCASDGCSLSSHWPIAFLARASGNLSKCCRRSLEAAGSCSAARGRSGAARGKSRLCRDGCGTGD